MEPSIAPLVLVVEDEPPQVEILRYNLEKAGFRVAVAGDGEEALLLAAEEPPDVVILDWMLPELSGIEVCRRLRRREETKHTPVIMLTARGEEGDVVRGLDCGADDYMVKPYSPSEMMARVRAVLRRVRPEALKECLSYGGIEMDVAAHRVWRDGSPVHLGPTEFRILRVLLERPGRVFTRERLLDLVWGRDADIDYRTVDVHIRRLRRALNAGGSADPIRTVRGSGYALDLPAHEAKR